MSSDHEPQKRKPTEADSASQSEMEEQPIQLTRSHAEILYLQRTLGNRAVAQMLKPSIQANQGQIQRGGIFGRPLPPPDPNEGYEADDDSDTDNDTDADESDHDIDIPAGQAAPAPASAASSSASSSNFSGASSSQPAVPMPQAASPAAAPASAASSSASSSNFSGALSSQPAVPMPQAASPAAAPASAASSSANSSDATASPYAALMPAAPVDTPASPLTASHPQPQPPGAAPAASVSSGSSSASSSNPVPTPAPMPDIAAIAAAAQNQQAPAGVPAPTAQPPAASVVFKPLLGGRRDRYSLYNPAAAAAAAAAPHIPAAAAAHDDDHDDDHDDGKEAPSSMASTLDEWVSNDKYSKNPQPKYVDTAEGYDIEFTWTDELDYKSKKYTVIAHLHFKRGEVQPGGGIWIHDYYQMPRQYWQKMAHPENLIALMKTKLKPNPPQGPAS